MKTSLRFPTKLGKYRGTQYWRFTVRLTQSGLNRTYWEHDAEVQIIAPSPAAACNAIKDEFAAQMEHPTEFECPGPKGGIAHRFLGFEGMIAAQMFACRPDWQQLKLI
jgi:hypothetical protein